MRGARDPLARRLTRGRRLARWALGWEGLWPRLWPSLGVAGLFVGLAWAGLFLAVPPWLHLALLALFAAALALAVWRPFRGFRWPGDAAAERRIEAATGLKHRPISTLRDHAVSEDPATLALWQAHQRRVLAGLTRLRVGGPRPNLAARDPRALRAGLLVALFAAFVAAGGEAGERLRRAFWPGGLHAVAALPALRLEAWVTPPAYTGAAPVFLDLGGGSLTVPQGSRLQLSLSGGGGGVPELQLDQAATPFRTLEAGSFALEQSLDRGARVALRRDGAELAAWIISVQADVPPTAAFAEPPGPAQRGLASRLPWRATDDWGVAAARAELRLAARPGAEPLVVELPVGGDPKQPRGLAQPDLSGHPWAGLPVRARILARDGAGQEGGSETLEFTLPERRFNHPVAQRLAALRKSLSLDPLARAPARRELDALSAHPEAFEHDLNTFLALRVTRFRLQRDRRPEAVDEAQALMWQIAVALEEGRTDRTARALAEAREALREALAEAESAPPDADQRAELERRVQELREAIQRHLEALAERLRQENAEPMAPDASQRLMDQRELDQRTREMEQAAREGRTDRMQQELAELERMLDALQNGQVAARPEGGRNNSRQQQQRQQGQQQMGAVQDMVQRQGQMLDRSHQRGEERAQQRPGQPSQQRGQPQERRQPGQAPQQGQQGQQGQPQQGEASAQADARQQRALRRALGELMQQFGDLTGEVPDALGRADQAMRRAQDALGQGRDATADQQEAIRELQEGGRQMAQSMERQFGQGEGQGEGQEDGQDSMGQAPGNGQDRAGQQAQGRDPLGRPTREGPGSNDQGSDTRVPEEAEMLRSRRIQEELRRRGAERERPPTELDYIERLLKSF
ncbi:TIGR02302 family protein [Teichococcus oryzae]|uniref:TIGR02302 family protein n=1 Tax=Teichococcus oryzae TaxID=1608942 RepID=A0A5B2TK22_9PROT|nr:TIGR02302 family protein [Pseudoroseomonas oryzae]KAA2214503.1 TIGR02302 family protein [Pseudoroseomonas oryzae]